MTLENVAVANVAVVGGGIAAFAARSALRAAGFRTLALVGTEPPVAPERLLVCPRLQRGESAYARFLRDAYREACAFYERSPHNKAIVARGALRLPQSAEEQKRWRALAQELPNLCRWLSASEAQRKSGLQKNAARWGGILLPHALVLQPRRLWEQDETTLKVSVTRTTQEADGSWRLVAKNEEGEQKILKAEAVVLALGAHLPAFLQESVFARSLPPLKNLLAALQKGRGRIDICDRAALSCPPLLPVCASGWVMAYPRARVGVVRGTAPSRAHEGEHENRKRLHQWCGLPVSEMSATEARFKKPFEKPFEKPYEASRLSTRDRLPLLGEIPCNGNNKSSRLFLFAGLGGHGFLTAPLCAQKLVRLLQRHDAMSVPAETTLLSPQRFLSSPRR